MKIDRNITEYILGKVKKVNLKNVVWREGDYFVSQCLNVEVSSFGKTKMEALENLEEALHLYFEDLENPQILKIKGPEIVDGRAFYA